MFDFVLVFKWVKDHSKLVLGLVLILGVLLLGYGIWHAGYSAGKEESDKTWTKTFNDNVDGLNKKIKTLEDTSKQQAEDLANRKPIVVEKIREVIVKAPPIVLHDAAGNVLMKPGCPTDVYLGPEFTAEWNRLNEAPKNISLQDGINCVVSSLISPMSLLSEGGEQP